MRFFLLTVLLAGCSSAPPPSLNAFQVKFPALSKTHKTPPKTKLKAGPKVSEQFCTTEGDLMTRIGIADALTQKAQEKTKADYILNADIKRVGEDCFELKGTAAFIGEPTAAKAP